MVHEDTSIVDEDKTQYELKSMGEKFRAARLVSSFLSIISHLKLSDYDWEVKR